MIVRIALILFLALFSLSGCAPQADAPAAPPEETAVSSLPAEETPTPAPIPSPEPSAEPAPGISAPAIPEGDTPQEQFLAFLEQVNQARRALCGQPLPCSTQEFTADLSGLEDDFTQEEMQSLLNWPGEIEAVTAAQARQDVETAFKLLRHSYGAYDYFGGDAVFLPLRDAALERLPETGQVTRAQLEELLMEVLAPVLVDGHFLLGSSAPRSVHIRSMYYVPNLYFDDPAGVDPQLVKPTIDGEGRLRLCLAVAASETEASSLPASAVVEGEAVSLHWTRDNSELTGDSVFAEDTLEDGTPLLISRAMYAQTQAGLDELDRLAACGADYAQSPLLVFDVRSNSGGSDRYIMDFFQGYTGAAFHNRPFWAMKYSPLTLFAYGMQDQEPGWSIHSDPGQWVERDGLTLVLQDGGVASSGETVINAFRTLDNTLFIGCGTLGCSLTPNCFAFYLPHSGLGFYFGTGLALYDDGVNFDCTGYPPDLWVPSHQARTAAERMIACYGLEDILTQS